MQLTTVEVPQVQCDEVLDVPAPQTIEKVMDPSAATEHLNTAVTKSAAQRTKAPLASAREVASHVFVTL